MSNQNGKPSTGHTFSPSPRNGPLVFGDASYLGRPRTPPASVSFLHCSRLFTARPLRKDLRNFHALLQRFAPSTSREPGDAAVMTSRAPSTRGGVVEYATCFRCHGLMMAGFTNFLLVEITQNTSATAWRCVNCGEWSGRAFRADRSLTASAWPGKPPGGVACAPQRIGRDASP